MSQVLISEVDNKIFDTSIISIQIQKDIPDKNFRKFYKPRAGINLDFKSPSYIGSIQANLSFGVYDNLEYQYDNNTYVSEKFIYIHPNIGWGLTLKLGKKIDWFNGLGMGAYVYYFERYWDVEMTFGTTETEVCFNLLSMIHYNLNKNFQLVFSIKNNHLFTYQDINIISTSIGVSKIINNPKWLSRILK
tara:strand:- start:2436 stop:3005 length:570 start_codon:yes stop_codon:yes gene_type:complete